VSDMSIACRVSRYSTGLSRENLGERFNRDGSTVMRLIKALEEHLGRRCLRLLLGKRAFHPALVNRARLVHYAERVKAKGCPYDRPIFGFIDGCRLATARPGGNALYQEAFYSGCAYTTRADVCFELCLGILSKLTFSCTVVWDRYVHHHCVTYHMISTPDGMIAHCFGPLEGRKTDRNVLKESDILSYMDRHPGVCITAMCEGAPWHTQAVCSLVGTRMCFCYRWLCF